MSNSFVVRRAHSGDEAVIANHRVGMFRDMGSLLEPNFDVMHSAAVSWLTRTLVSGEYLGWLAHAAEDPEAIVGGAGVLLRDAPPTVLRGGEVGSGKQALVINVYTEPAWRHRGVARLLMQALIEEMRALRVLQVVLHASDDGRHLYESLGFLPTNEMRLNF